MVDVTVFGTVEQDQGGLSLEKISDAVAELLGAIGGFRP